MGKAYQAAYDRYKVPAGKDWRATILPPGSNSASHVDRALNKVVWREQGKPQFRAWRTKMEKLDKRAAMKPKKNKKKTAAAIVFQKIWRGKKARESAPLAIVDDIPIPRHKTKKTSKRTARCRTGTGVITTTGGARYYLAASGKRVYCYRC